MESGVVMSDLSDHFPIVMFLNYVYKSPPTNYKITNKVLNERTLLWLYESLETKAWTNVLNVCDPDTKYNTLIHEISEAVSKTIPERIVTSRKNEQNPWLTKMIQQSIYHKYKPYKRYLKNPSDHNKMKYHLYRNKLAP